MDYIMILHKNTHHVPELIQQKPSSHKYAQYMQYSMYKESFLTTSF